MSSTSANPDPSSSSPSRLGRSSSVVIARVVGILCVAAGFVVGIQGLEQPDSRLLPTALGLIAAGVIAQLFALVRTWYLWANRTQ